jgi:hypothetical protein
VGRTLLSDAFDVGVEVGVGVDLEVASHGIETPRRFRGRDWFARAGRTFLSVSYKFCHSDRSRSASYGVAEDLLKPAKSVVDPGLII